LRIQTTFVKGEGITCQNTKNVKEDYFSFGGEIRRDLMMEGDPLDNGGEDAFRLGKKDRFPSPEGGKPEGSLQSFEGKPKGRRVYETKKG